MQLVAAVRAALRAGFYAVLDRDDEHLARTLVGAGGARVLQVRLKPRALSHAAANAPAARNLKPAAVDDIVRVAKMARRVCSEADAHLIVNDRIDIALAVGADGVHLGQTDIPLDVACALVGTKLAIGVSTHNLEQVERAAALAPAYLAYGPIFTTPTKQNPDPVQGITALRAAVQAAGDVPVVAIGGITPATARQVYGARATAICAISAVNAAPDVAEAARALGRWSPWPTSSGAYSVRR